MESSMGKAYVGKVGFRFREEILRPGKQLIEELKNYSTCNLADGTHSAYVMGPGIKPVGKPRSIVGPVVTVELPAGDNLMLHKAMALAKPGDILVVQLRGGKEYSACGGLMLRRMKALGIQGVIVDGYVRDLLELENVGLAVYARGLIPAGTEKNGPGQINFPIACGGVAVLPGYLAVADANGILCFPPEDAKEIIRGAKNKLQREAHALQEIQEGHLLKADIDSILQTKGILCGKEG